MRGAEPVLGHLKHCKGLAMNELHNRVRSAVDELGLQVIVHDHDTFELPIDSPSALSEILGFPLERITKSVLLQQQSGDGLVLAVCPVSRRIDIKSISRQLGLRRLEVADTDSLSDNLGYQRLGVSPLGLPPDIAVVIDESLLTYPTIVVGGGNIGIEVELSPGDLARACNGQMMKIAGAPDSIIR